ncbi:hypothetical protein ACXR2U_14490 [Jatrophihabitans sp. YIM 134969]
MTDAYAAGSAENPHAGQGTAVVLDIGGDIGAVVVTCPEDLTGREIEIVPAGSRGPGGRYADAPEHDHAHGPDDDHDHHDHAHDDHAHDDHGHAGDFHAGHHHPPGTPPHVGVVPRPMGDRLVPTAVFGDLVEGAYELSLRPYRGEVDLTVEVVGGQVATVSWPAST